MGGSIRWSASLVKAICLNSPSPFRRRPIVTSPSSLKSSAEPPPSGWRRLLTEDNKVISRSPYRRWRRTGTPSRLYPTGVRPSQPWKGIVRRGPDGCPDAGNGRIRGHRPDSRGRGVRRPAHANCRHDGAPDVRRSRTVPPSRDGRLRQQASRSVLTAARDYRRHSYDPAIALTKARRPVAAPPGWSGGCLVKSRVEFIRAVVRRRGGHFRTVPPLGSENAHFAGNAVSREFQQPQVDLRVCRVSR